MNELVTLYWNQFLEIYNKSTYVDYLKSCIIFQAVCTVGFFISSVFVIKNQFSGFNAIFTGIVYVIHCIGSYYGVSNIDNGLWYGVLLGTTSMLSILTLQTAIYWGQYSQCDPHSNSMTTQCVNIDAMVSLEVFAIFIFLSLVVQCTLLVRYKDMILSNPLSSSSSSKEGAYSKVHESNIQMQMHAQASRPLKLNDDEDSMDL